MSQIATTRCSCRRPAPIPSFRFLDFLIYDAIPAVVVNVPAPERYAVHKLIVSYRRQKDTAKVAKDWAQATEPISTLWEFQREDIVRVFDEAARRSVA